MKIFRQMPTTVILMFFSLLFAAGAVTLGVCMFLNQSGLPVALCITALGLFFAVCVRAAANAGQMFFDGKTDNFRLLSEIKGHLEAQNKILAQNAQTLSQIAQSMAQNAQAAAQHAQILTQAVNNIPRENRETVQKLGEDLRARIDGLGQSLRSISEAIQAGSRDDQKQARELLERLKGNNDSLSALTGVSDKISCDSKDINQGIQQIRDFFERIERQLDLKK